MKRRKPSKSAEDIRNSSRGKGIPAGGRHFAQWFSRWKVMLAAGLIVLAGAAAYSNSLRCDFVYDDGLDILGNPSIRHLWPIWDVFVVRSDGQTAIQPRPVVNL
jgi:hypothetical protein